MSFHALAWATRQRLPSMQKLVLIMLAERHNRDTGQCNPSHDVLADDCGLTRRSVMDQISKLKDAGYIRVLHRAKGQLKLPNQYMLNLHFGVQEEVKEPLNDPHLVVNDVHQGSEPRSLPVVNQVHQVVNDVHQGSEPRSHKPGIEPGKEPGKKKQRASTPAAEHDFSSWPSQPSPQVLADWLHLRKKRRADVTPTVLATFGRELHKAAGMGFTVDECLAKCCSRNWQGFEASWLERDLPNNSRNLGANHAPRRESAVERVQRNIQRAEEERSFVDVGAVVIEGNATVVVAND